MKEVIIEDSRLRAAASEGNDAFVKVFVDAINGAIGGELNADTLPQLNADQVTLLAYDILHTEVMDGGFVQLIHNGYGAFIFKNPFGKAVRQWGLDDLARVIKKVHRLYSKDHEEIERDCTDEEFMALFERMAEFDDFDDCFVENDEELTDRVAHYIDVHIDRFATIKD